MVSYTFNPFTGNLDAINDGTVTGTGSNFQVSFWNGATSQAGDTKFIWDNTNKRLAIGTTTLPTALLHLGSGTTGSNTAPLKFSNGSPLMTTAETGAVEFQTDDLFFTITTGAARKKIPLADPVAGLTSGRVAVTTTNGRLSDTSNLTYTSGTGMTITAGAASSVPLKLVNFNTTQTGDPLQVQNNSLVTMAKIDPSGAVFAGGNGQSLVQLGMIVNNSLDTTANSAFNVYGGSDTNLIYTDAANDRIGMGTNSPASKLHVTSTTEQLRLGYNASNYLSMTIGSAGSAIFSLTGSTPTFTFSQEVDLSADLKFNTAGKGIFMASGTNAKIGNATLSGGTINVITNVVNGSSFLFLTDTGGGVVANIGQLYVSGIVNGSYFTVNSTNILDNSKFNWFIIDKV